ncbi:S1 RNA-binding domain-containing protein [Streptomyces sp. cg35]|uniref:S1 RNA-binding domain-containing protein n=1 Tax=Streptomyces sp. cg35 TaxID=3421650 RepID=UPI003D181610
MWCESIRARTHVTAVEGLVPLQEFASAPVGSPSDAVRVGDAMSVVVTSVGRAERRLFLAGPRASAPPSPKD